MIVGKPWVSEKLELKHFEVWSKPLTFFRVYGDFHKQPQNVLNIHMKTQVPKFLFKQSCRPQARNIINKETMAQVVSCEFCEIFKNIFFTEHLRETASGFSSSCKKISKNMEQKLCHFSVIQSKSSKRVGKTVSYNSNKNYADFGILSNK